MLTGPVIETPVSKTSESVKSLEPISSTAIPFPYRPLRESRGLTGNAGSEFKGSYCTGWKMKNQEKFYDPAFPATRAFGSTNSGPAFRPPGPACFSSAFLVSLTARINEYPKRVKRHHSLYQYSSAVVFYQSLSY